MPFRAYDIQASRFQNDFLVLGDFVLDIFYGGFFLVVRPFRVHFFHHAHFDVTAELDVGSATGHVGGNGDSAGFSGLRDNVGLLFVMAGVEDVMLDFLFFQAGGEFFRFFNRNRTDENGLLAFLTFLDQRNNRIVFLAEGFVDFIIVVFARYGNVSGDFNDFETVNLFEFGCFGQRRSRHSREFRVQAEIILEGNGGKGLVLGLDFHALFGFYSLMQAFGEAAPFHHAACEFVNQDDLVVLDNIVGIAVEELVGAQGLIHMMHQRNIADIVHAAFF